MPPEELDPPFPCVLRLFYQTGRLLHNANVERQFQDAHSSGLSVVLDTFSAPFPDYLPLDNFYAFRGHLRYQLGCEFVLIYHFSNVEAIQPLINLSSMRNAHIFSSASEDQSVRTYESESVNIITVPLQNSQNFDILHELGKVKRKTPKSRGDPLRNRFLRVSFYELKPHYYHAKNKTVGIAYDMIQAASEHYNFTYNITLDPAIVTTDPDGKLRGMENEVIHGRIDMNFLYAPTFLPPGANVEASTYYSPASIVFLAQLPQRKTKWTAILYAFELDSWLVTLCTCCAFAVAVFATIKRSHTECKNAAASSFFIVFNGLLGQEIHFIPLSARSLTILWLFMSFVLTNYYCSNLLSLLTYPEVDPVPRDMVELALREDYKIVGIDLPGGSMEQYFNQSTSWELVKIWKQASFLPMVKCVTEAVVTPKQVCLGWDFMTEGFLQTNATVNEFFYPALKSRNPPLTVLTCGVLQKNSPYTDGINEVVGWCRDTGLYYKWLYESERLTKLVGKSWLMSAGQRGSEITRELISMFRGNFNEGEPEPFRLVNLTAPFVQLAVGFVLALITFGYELGVQNGSSCWKPKKDGGGMKKLKGLMGIRVRIVQKNLVILDAGTHEVLQRYGYKN